MYHELYFVSITQIQRINYMMTSSNGNSVYYELYFASFSQIQRINYMMTSSNGTFSALLAICAGNSPVPGEFPAQRPVTRSFDASFHLRLNKRLINNHKAGDLRRYCAQYNVTVMKFVNLMRSPIFMMEIETRSTSLLFMQILPCLFYRPKSSLTHQLAWLHLPKITVITYGNIDIVWTT